MPPDSQKHTTEHHHHLTKPDNPDMEPDSEQPDASPDSENPWHYRTTDQASEPLAQPIHWSASEYIDHEKPATWFLAVAGVAVLISGLVYLVSRDLINSIVIIIVAAMFAVLGARKPHILDYGLDNGGIQVGNKFYPYGLFRSFAIINEGAINSILLSQFKRFTTPITLYIPQEQEEEIINFLGNFLPLELHQLDPIDRLMRKVRF